MSIVYSRDIIEQQLDAWLKANIAVSQGQSYTIGSRMLSRANASEILKQIKFWQSELDKLDALERKKARSRIYRIVPRD